MYIPSHDSIFVSWINNMDLRLDRQGAIEVRNELDRLRSIYE